MGELVGVGRRVPLELEHVAAHYHDFADGLQKFVCHVAFGRGLPESLVDAEGVVNQAFIEMISSSKTINDPRAWLCIVARNMVGKIAERHQRRRADGDPYVLLDTSTARWSTLTPQASAECRYEARQVLEALEELPNRQKQAIYLYRVLGWTGKEIADVLKISEAAVREHIRRGTKRLRERVGVKMIIGIIVTAIAAILESLLGGNSGGAAKAASTLIPLPNRNRQPKQSDHMENQTMLAQGFANRNHPTDRFTQLVVSGLFFLFVAGFILLLGAWFVVSLVNNLSGS